MILRRSLLLSPLPALLLYSTIARAQATGAAELFASANNSFPGGEPMAGLSLSIRTGALGVRGNFSWGFGGMGAHATATRAARWSSDGDVLLRTDFQGSSLGGSVIPYAFAGIGLQSGAASPSANDASHTWSYGGGLELPLSHSVRVTAEARNRRALGTMPANAGFVAGAEYRAGISIVLGNRKQGRYERRAATRFPTPGTSGTHWPASDSRASGAARRVVPSAERYIGVPYVYGGTSPVTGFDCSGFVQYVYGEQGVSLPRTSRQMSASGRGVSPTPSAMVAGDLMLFTQNGRISHVALYAGGGRFIHSSSSGGGVRYDDLGTQRGRWFSDHLVEVRRVSENGRTIANALTGAMAIAFDHFDPPDMAPRARAK